MTQGIFYLLVLVAVMFMLGVLAALLMEDRDDDG